MNVLFLCVNYNSYIELENYLASIIDATNNYSLSKLYVEAIISDNSDKGKFFNIDKFKKHDKSFKISIISHFENLGYLGGIDRAINSIPINHFYSFDFVIVSNVDILLPTTFFSNLYTEKTTEQIAWIAPSIVSSHEKKNRNPKILSRPSLLKLKLLKMIFISPIIYQCYVKLIYKKKKGVIVAPKSYIYAGHGSFMIFTNHFITKIRNFSFGSFLFCEEIYIAELARLHEMKVIYIPSIYINDIDHISTGKVRATTYCKWNRNSINYIIKNFFND